MDLKSLTEKQLRDLLEHQKRVLFIVNQPGYGFEKYSRQTIESLVNEALDIILLINQELERRKK
jgi:hypothetical protein